jgi:hypothetical protein
VLELIFLILCHYRRVPSHRFPMDKCSLHSKLFPAVLHRCIMNFLEIPYLLWNSFSTQIDPSGWIAPLFHVSEFPVSNLGSGSVCFDWNVPGSTQTFQANAGAVPQINPLGSTSLIILPFKAKGHAGVWLVEALCYKPEGPGFDSRLGKWILFIWPNLYSRTMALGWTQSLTEMSTRNLPEGKGRPAHKSDNFTVICEQTV